MSDQDIEKIDYSTLRKALYGDMLSDKTEKSARTLLIVAAATLLVSVFQVSLKSTAIIPVEFSKENDGLVMFLAAANAVLFAAFVIRLLPDLLRTREEWAFAAKIVEQEKILRAEAAARAVDQQIAENDPGGENYGREPDDWWQDYIATTDEAMAQMQRLQDRIEDRRISITFRFVRLILQCVFPLLVSITAFLHTADDAWRFIRAVVGI
jgi:hypothetical protein